MKNLKQAIDEYFGLEYNEEGQVLYYGVITFLIFIIGGGIIANLIFNI